ncbi:diguanylate cyclase [Duganella sp. FT92W]|uniref:diguanylate cyclase n=2 Tax=Pseudoduganella rivuli TaxID=2666085 RepID=A0A7X2IMW2_9BURK|nr:GGDEF domain-containing protein [Pseudoduganella rivuli]MRV72759.1 diguanylate cyclase [Pseudoduganella rivuli]
MTTLMSVAMSIVMHSAHSNFGKEVKGLDRWAMGLLALVGGGVAFMLRDEFPQTPLPMATNALLFCGIGLSMIGTQEFFGRQPSWRTFWAIAAGGFVLIGWFLVIKPDFAARVTIFSFLVFYFYAEQVRLVWRHGTPHFSTRFFGTLIGIQALVVLVRGCMALRAMVANIDLMRDNAMANIYLGVANFMALMLTVAFMTMATRRLQTILEQRSTHDPLTGVLNRRGFAMFYEHQRLQMRRAGKPITLMAIDLDHFKAVNDRFGHMVGDKVLVQVARAIRQTLRETDDVARFGGEEFVVLLPDSDEHNAVLAAERIRDALRRFADIQLPMVTVSIGIGCHASEQESLDALLARTDAALYRAKENGRDRIEIAM